MENKESKVLDRRSKKEEVFDDISVMEQARSILDEKVLELKIQRESLENQLTSLRYQLDQEKAQSKININLEREKMLQEIKIKESKIGERDRVLIDKELLLSSREDEVRRQEDDIMKIRKKALSFNEERMQIERMRVSAEKLMEEAKQLKASMENEYKALSTKIESLNRYEADLKDRESLVLREEGNLKILKENTDRATIYYEKIRDEVRSSLKEE